MKRYKGGEDVEKGVYLNRKTGEIINLIRSGGTLPGQREAEYNRIPAVAMLIFGPFVGLVYVMFLPFIAFGMLVWYGMDRLVRALSPVHEGVMGMAAPAWSPVQAHLDGKVKTAAVEAEEDEKAPVQDEERSLGNLLADLEIEIKEKRKEE